MPAMFSALEVGTLTLSTLLTLPGIKGDLTIHHDTPPGRPRFLTPIPIQIRTIADYNLIIELNMEEHTNPESGTESTWETRQS